MPQPSSILTAPSAEIRRLRRSSVPDLLSSTYKVACPNLAAGRCWRLVGSAVSAAGGLRSFRLVDEFALNHDLDLLADHEPAIKGHVEAQAEVLPVDLCGGAVSDPVSHHPRVVALPVLRHLERHRAAVALDGQVTGQRVAVRPGRLDAGALERDHRELLRLEEVRRAEVVVPDPVVGADAGS